jgi:hypothetical protein
MRTELQTLEVKLHEKNEDYQEDLIALKSKALKFKKQIDNIDGGSWPQKFKAVVSEMALRGAQTGCNRPRFQ